jgi:hypothetical protein
MVNSPDSQGHSMRPAPAEPRLSTADDAGLAIVVCLIAAASVGGLSLVVIEIVELLRQFDFQFYWNTPSLSPSFLPHFP